MASFDEHISQVKKNLAFLVETNSRRSVHWDWQVTVCFYTAVHFVNAHIAKVANLHYRTHEDVKNIINPHNLVSIARVPEDVYLCYAKLEGLSRRARYLCHDDPQKKDDTGFFTYDKHFAKAIKNLDKIAHHFIGLYSLSIGRPVVQCSDLSKSTPLNFFTVES